MPRTRASSCLITSLILTQGHTVEQLSDDAMHTLITGAEQLPVCIHGTTREVQVRDAQWG